MMLKILLWLGLWAHILQAGSNVDQDLDVVLFVVNQSAEAFFLDLV